MPEDIDNKPLVIKDIREVLIPAMEEVFATKKDLAILTAGLKQDIADLRAEFKKEIQEKFNELMNGHDKILKDIETLMIEKTVGYYRKKKERKLWLMIVDALSKHKILSPDQLSEIKALEIF